MHHAVAPDHDVGVLQHVLGVDPTEVPLAGTEHDGHVIVEVNTRRAVDRIARESDLAEALAFCRLHLVAPPAPVAPPG